MAAGRDRNRSFETRATFTHDGNRRDSCREPRYTDGHLYVSGNTVVLWESTPSDFEDAQISDCLKS
jgi:hypothetical protein